MFGLDIQSAKAKREFNPIPYSVAVKRKPKQGKSYWVTPVTWVGAPVVLQAVEFLTVPQCDVVLKPSLPAGYSIEWHDSWVELVKRIYTPERVANMSFDELDKVVLDIYTFEKVVGKSVEWFNIWSDRRDYCDYAVSFDESWNGLEYDIKTAIVNLLEASVPHEKPQAKSLGNRVFAPSMEVALSKMFDNIPAEYVAAIAQKLEQFKSG